MDEFSQLVSRLTLPDEEAVIDAAHALGALGDPRAVAVLIDVLETTHTSAIRNAAAIGLRDLGDARAVPVLIRQINDPKTRDDRGTLVYALEPLDARSALVDLARILCAGNFEVMQMVLFVLEALPDPLPPQQTKMAIELIQRCVEEQHLNEWQHHFLAAAIELLDERSM